MNTVEIEGINVASKTSTSGHFIQGARRVVNLNEVKDTYFVEGKSQLVTKNHTTLNQERSCLITTQVVYNPFAKMFEQSKD
jgi:hypothetical protein